MLIDAKMNPRKLQLWTRGIDTECFTPIRRSGALRDRWRVDHRRPAVLYVGRLSHEKGLDMLPAFQASLHRRGIEHRLILVGEGPMRAELQARCPDAIFTGALPHEQVAACMASSDVFIFPSETDAAGNVVLEAQASGLPVVVSMAGGPREEHRAGHDRDRAFSQRRGWLCSSDRAGRARSAEAARNGRGGAGARAHVDVGTGAPAPVSRVPRGRLGVGPRGADGVTLFQRGGSQCARLRRDRAGVKRSSG